jgi:hypothetical protein
MRDKKETNGQVTRRPSSFSLEETGDLHNFDKESQTNE